MPRCAHTQSPVPSGAVSAARLAHTRPGPQRAPTRPPQLAPSEPRQRAQQPHSSRAAIQGAGQGEGSGQRSSRHGPHSRCRLPASRSPRLRVSDGSSRSSSGRRLMAGYRTDGSSASAPLSARCAQSHRALPAPADWPGLHRGAPLGPGPAPRGPEVSRTALPPPIELSGRPNPVQTTTCPPALNVRTLDPPTRTPLYFVLFPVLFGNGTL